MLMIAQALLVQSALNAMSRRGRNSNPVAQHASARENQLSSTVEGQMRTEYDADLAAAVERAQEVRSLPPYPHQELSIPRHSSCCKLNKSAISGTAESIYLHGACKASCCASVQSRRRGMSERLSMR